MSCPALRLDGSAGLADALPALDCRSGEAVAQAFGRLFGANGALLPALTILLTLYVALFAVRLLTGRARVGVAALTPRMLTLGLALTFATSWAAYSQTVWTLAVGAPDQVATLLAGTHGSATRAFAERIDVIFAAIADAADQARQQQQAAAVPAALAQAAPVAAAQSAPALASAPTLLWLSGLLLLLGTVGVLVTSKIALAALLALGPVFIVLALFPATRGLFEGWLKAATLFAVVPLFAVLIGGGALGIVTPVVRAAVMAQGEEATRATTMLFIAACVYVTLLLIAVRATAMIVAGWRVFGGRDEAAGAGGAAASAAMPAAVAAATLPLSSAAARTDERVRGIVLGAPAAANDAAPRAAIADPRVRGVVALPGAAEREGAPPPRRDQRLHGVGSRFRRPPSNLPRDRQP